MPKALREYSHLTRKDNDMKYKFQGKRKDNGDIIYGSLLLINGTAYIYQNTFGDIEDIVFGYGFVEVDIDTVKLL